MKTVRQNFLVNRTLGFKVRWGNQWPTREELAETLIADKGHIVEYVALEIDTFNYHGLEYTTTSMTVEQIIHL
jgi:hypothetical protein